MIGSACPVLAQVDVWVLNGATHFLTWHYPNAWVAALAWHSTALALPILHNITTVGTSLFCAVHLIPIFVVAPFANWLRPVPFAAQLRTELNNPGVPRLIFLPCFLYKKAGSPTLLAIHCYTLVPANILKVASLFLVK